jgi:hypothetical protein
VTSTAAGDLGDSGEISCASSEASSSFRAIGGEGVVLLVARDSVSGFVDREAGPECATRGEETVAERDAGDVCDMPVGPSVSGGLECASDGEVDRDEMRLTWDASETGSDTGCATGSDLRVDESSVEEMFVLALVSELVLVLVAPVVVVSVEDGPCEEVRRSTSATEAVAIANGSQCQQRLRHRAA